MKEIEEFIISILDDFLLLHPNEFIITTGDFNKMKTQNIEIHLNLQNIILEHTRGKSLLDYFLVHKDLIHIYPTSDIGAPIGSSDHKTIIVSPIFQHNNLHNNRTYTVIDYRESHVKDFVNYLVNVNRQILDSFENLDDMIKIFNFQIQILLKLSIFYQRIK